MAERIDEIRARAIAAREGYPVHVGCGGELSHTASSWVCNGCGRHPAPVEIMPSERDRIDHEDYVEDVTHLLALVDELRERVSSAETTLDTLANTNEMLERENRALRERAEKAAQRIETACLMEGLDDNQIRRVLGYLEPAKPMDERWRCGVCKRRELHLRGQAPDGRQRYECGFCGHRHAEESKR